MNAAQEEKRKARARQSMDLLAQQGLDIGASNLETKELALRAVHVELKLFTSFRPSCKLVPTQLCFLPEHILVCGKCGELLRYSFPACELCAPAIELVAPLRGAKSERKHPFCLKYKKIGPAWQNSHCGAVLCASAALSGNLIVTGGVDCTLNVRNAELTSLCTLLGDLPVVAAALTEQNCAFADGQRIRVFGISTNVQSSPACEIGTLYGPTDAITHLAPVPGENAVLCVSDDRSLRYFELIDLTQFIYLAGYPLTACCAIDQQTFVAGGTEGLCLFNKEKKEPIHRIMQDKRILCAASCPGYNVIFAGYQDGISVFGIVDGHLQQTAEVECTGFVNAMDVRIVGTTLYLAACGGRERPGDRMEVLSVKPWVSVWEIAHVEAVQAQKRKNRFKL